MPVRTSVFCPSWPSVMSVSWRFPFCSDQVSHSSWPRPSEPTSLELASRVLFLCWSREREGEKRQPKLQKICWGVKYIPFGPTIWAVSCLSHVRLRHVILPFRANPATWKRSPKAWSVESPGCHLCPGSGTGFEHCQGWIMFRSRTWEVQSQHLFPKEMFVSPFNLEPEMPFV